MVFKVLEASANNIWLRNKLLMSFIDMRKVDFEKDVVASKKVKHVPPNYPKAAKDAGKSGKVVRTKLYDRLVARPYAEIVTWLSARFRDAGIDPPDLDALTLILIESMGAYKELNRVFGQVPADIDDERFIAAWVDTALTVAHQYGLK